MSETTLKPAAYRQGVGIMLVNVHGRVLICRRVDLNVDSFSWQMPQGGIDAGEDPKKAALRELKEEIGIDSVVIVAESKHWYQYDIPESLLANSRHSGYRGQRQKWFLMRFTGRDDDIDLSTGHPEFSGWLWVPPEHLPDLVVSFKQDVYRDVVAEFRDRCRPTFMKAAVSGGKKKGKGGQRTRGILE